MAEYEWSVRMYVVKVATRAIAYVSFEVRFRAADLPPEEFVGVAVWIQAVVEADRMFTGLALADAIYARAALAHQRILVRGELIVEFLAA